MSNKSEKLMNLVKEGAREYRNMEIRVAETDQEQEEKQYRVKGYATTFNQPYMLWEEKFDDGYTIRVFEEVDASAFDNTDLSDVIMQYDHEGRVFARGSNNTLAVAKDQVGLGIEADLGGTTIGRQLYEEIDGGYTTKMSIGFTVDESEWKTLDANEEGVNEAYLRSITAIRKLYDVSAVSLPANDFTSISARSVCDGVIANVEAERLRAKEDAERRRRLDLRIKVMKGEH